MCLQQFVKGNFALLAMCRLLFVLLRKATAQIVLLGKLNKFVVCKPRLPNCTGRDIFEGEQNDTFDQCNKNLCQG